MKNIKKYLFSVLLILFSMTLHVNKAHAFFGLFGDSNVEMVRGGTFAFDNSITLGQALEGNKFLKNPEWESFEDGQGRIYVQFLADVDTNFVYIEKGGTQPSYKFPLQMKIQFVINKDETFNPKYLVYTDSFGYEIYKPYNLDKLIADLKAIYQNDISDSVASPIFNISQSPIVFITNGYYYKLKENNFYERIKSFVEQGADIDSLNKENMTSLLDVIRNKECTTSLIDALLRNGANANFIHKSGTSPLRMAIIHKRNLEIIQLLLDYGADVNISVKNNYPLVIQACLDNYIDAMRLLIAHGADIDATDNDGRTALLIMIGASRFELIKLLLEYGADPYIKDKRGHDAFYYARNYARNDKILDLLNQYPQNNQEIENGTKFIREGKEFIGTFLDFSDNPEWYAFVFQDEAGNIYDLVVTDVATQNMLTEKNFGKKFKIKYEVREYFHEGGGSNVEDTFIKTITPVNNS